MSEILLDTPRASPVLKPAPAVTLPPPLGTSARKRTLVPPPVVPDQPKDKVDEEADTPVLEDETLQTNGTEPPTTPIVPIATFKGHKYTYPEIRALHRNVCLLLIARAVFMLALLSVVIALCENFGPDYWSYRMVVVFGLASGLIGMPWIAGEMLFTGRPMIPTPFDGTAPSIAFFILECLRRFISFHQKKNKISSDGAEHYLRVAAGLQVMLIVGTMAIAVTIVSCTLARMIFVSPSLLGPTDKKTPLQCTECWRAYIILELVGMAVPFMFAYVYTESPSGYHVWARESLSVLLHTHPISELIGTVPWCLWIAAIAFVHSVFSWRLAVFTHSESWWTQTSSELVHYICLYTDTHK